MASGIFSSTITNLVNGTTANASDVLASLNSLKSNGVNNDGGTIQTDGSGHIFTPQGELRSVVFITPYHLTTNPTVNSGVTTTLTCTGVGGIPSGTTAILLGIGVFAATTGGYVQIAPHGGTLGQYVNFSGDPSNAYTTGFAIVPLSAGGQIDVKANASNIVLQDWYIFGYII